MVPIVNMTGTWVRYGEPANGALRDAIAGAKDGEPLAPVTVVVPSNQVGVAARRLLASGRLGPVCGAGPGLVGVTFVTPYRLAELLAAPTLAASGRRPVSTPVLTAAVRASLEADPGVFAPVAQHAATESALVTAYQELRDLDDDSLDLLARQSPRARDVLRLHRHTRRSLVDGWYDEQDLIAEAIGVIDDLVTHDPQHLGRDMGSVVVHLPQRLSRHAGLLLAELASATSVQVIAGRTGDGRADHDVVASVSRLGLALPDLADPGPAGPLVGLVHPDRTRIITASDADEEIRQAVRVVIDAVRGGMPLDRIAVLHSSPEPYARLLTHHFEAAGITTNGPSGIDLTQRLAGRTLLGALALPSGGYRRGEVMAWLSGAPILHQGRLVPTGAWERISRDAGVVRTSADWQAKLDQHAERLEAEAERAADPAEDEPEWKVERATAEGRRARDLRAFVAHLVETLDDAEATPRTWPAWATWARQLLNDLLGGASRRAAWPEAEARAGERLDTALDRLGSLGTVEGAVSLAVFTRTLEVELESDLARVGRFGEGVLTAPVSLGVGVDLDLVVLVGLAEGTFPATVRDDSLLPDDERRQIGDALALRSGHVDRLHHRFLATLAGARHHVLTIPRGDLRRSAERVPSRWALAAASELAGERLWSGDLFRRVEPWLGHIESFDAGIRNRPPATDQEHRLRSLLAVSPPRPKLLQAATDLDPTLAAGVEMVDQRDLPSITRFDGNLAGLHVRSPVARTSATRLERWVACPFGYFVQDLLRVEPVEDPEEALRISPLDKGNLVHNALERFILEVLDGTLTTPAPHEPWSATHHGRLRELGEEIGSDFEARGLTGRALFWRQDRRALLADLATTLRRDDIRRASKGLRPLHAELAFGFGDDPPVELSLPGGRVAAFRGKADRVDVADDGSLHVVDYKTGKADSYREISADDPHPGGSHLQLPIYAQAARLSQGDPEARVHASYWFISTRGQFKEIGYDVTPDVLARTTEIVATIGAGIDAGFFPAHPRHTTRPWPDCVYCDPDNLGVKDLERRWLAHHADPSLRPYLELCGLVDAETHDGTDEPEERR